MYNGETAAVFVSTHQQKLPTWPSLTEERESGRRFVRLRCGRVLPGKQTTPPPCCTSSGGWLTAPADPLRFSLCVRFRQTSECWYLSSSPIETSPVQIELHEVKKHSIDAAATDLLLIKNQLLMSISILAWWCKLIVCAMFLIVCS